MWTVEERRAKMPRGGVARVTRALDEKKQFVSKVLADQAGLYSAERVARCQWALADELGQERSKVFGDAP